MTEPTERISSLGPDEMHISLAGVDQFALLGAEDKNLRLLEARLDGSITVRGESMILKGPQGELETLSGVVLRLIDLLDRERELDPVSVRYVIEQHLAGETGEAIEGGETLFYATGTRHAIRAKTAGQQSYVDAIRDYDVVFAIGPAGTGKTYLAVAEAVAALA